MQLIINARLIAGVFLLLLFSACSTPQTRALRTTPPSAIQLLAEISGVIYFPQEEYQCGPATLAMVFQHAGLKVEPEQLKDSLYIPDKQGSLQVEMLATTRRQGLLAYQLQPELQDVLTEINAGNPVVVLQNLALSWYPLWHYAVVIGYDLKREEIILRSGTTQRLAMPFTTFEHTWARGKYWAMLALPPARLPQTAIPENWVQSINALEHSSPYTYTGAAYTEAMQRWPNHLLVTIAAGNHAYRHGKLNQAEQIFLTATEQHPESVAALNNLAQTQSDLGKYDAALQAIARAIDLGGPLQVEVRKTQLEIEQKKNEVLK
jgi:tetratricopeptide (TPR) repeat protein